MTDHLGLKKLFDAAKNNKEIAAKLKEAAVIAHYFDLANEFREIERNIHENPNDKEKKDEQDNDKIVQTQKKLQREINELFICLIILAAIVAGIGTSLILGIG